MNEETPNPAIFTTSSEQEEVDFKAKLASIESLAAIKASPKIAQQFARELLKDKGVRSLIYRSRPKGPYYNILRASELRPFLDQLISGEKKSLWFFVRNFKRANLNTLYNRIGQSYLYLSESPDIIKEYGLKYDDLRRATRLCRKGTGTDNEAVVIYWDKDYVKEVEPLQVGEALELEGKPWKAQVDAYLEDATALDPLLIKDLALSPEDIDELETSLGQLAGILANITSERIKIVKFKG